jgi:cytochrome P450
VLAGDPDGYTKNTPFNEEIAAYLGNGLLTSGGRIWRKQRRTVAPVLPHRRIAGYVDVMADEAARLADRCGATAAAGGSIDVNAAMVDYTLRTVGRVLFGSDVDDAIPVIRANLPVLNMHLRRRGLSLLRLPRRWPTPAQVKAAKPSGSCTALSTTSSIGGLGRRRPIKTWSRCCSPPGTRRPARH